MIKMLEDQGAAALAGVLSTELDIQTGRLDSLALSLSKLAEAAEGAAEEQRDRSLVAGLLYELAGAAARAREEYDRARRADPPARQPPAQIGCSDPIEKSALLLEHERTLDEGQAGALLLLEAAADIADSDPDTHARLLRLAHQKAPSLPLAAWIAERRARARGDFEAILEWLKDRREAAADPVEAAYDRVREALLIADRDLSARQGAARRSVESAAQRSRATRALRAALARSPRGPSAVLGGTGRGSHRAGSLAARPHGGARVSSARDASNRRRASRGCRWRRRSIRWPCSALSATKPLAGFVTNLTERLIEQARATEDVREQRRNLSEAGRSRRDRPRGHRSELWAGIARYSSKARGFCRASARSSIS